MRDYRSLSVCNQNKRIPQKVKHIIVEEGITKIKAGTFHNRWLLESIILSQSLREIEDGNAFASCCALITIFIPKSVSKIGSTAFAWCRDLREVTFEKDSKLKSIGKCAFGHCRSLKMIVVPKSVMMLGEYAFNGSDNLESVVFQEGSQLQVIPRYCFSECRKLKVLTIPDLVTVVQQYAFDCCQILASIYFTTQSNLQHIDEQAFRQCPNLQFVNIPPTALSIHNEASLHYNTVSTSPDQHQLLHWFKHGDSNLPMHQQYYRDINDRVLEKLTTIPDNDSSFIEQDECGLTPLHIACSNPHATVKVIKKVYNKCRGAATVINAKGMTPWHMYLVTKGVITCMDFLAISNGHDHYHYSMHHYPEMRSHLQVSDIAKALLREDVSLNNIHNLIDIGLQCDNGDVEDLYDVSLVLHGVSFGQECCHLNGTTRLYPCMTMAASKHYTLCHVYDMAMRSVHNIQSQNYL